MIGDQVPTDTKYDIIIKSGFVFDGLGNGGIMADIGITNGKIAYIGSLSNAKARRFIDASGKIVAPGFIDIHTHADRDIERIPSAGNYLLQGVTTVLGGNCGASLAGVDVGRFLGGLTGLAINFGTLVGFGDIRTAALADPTIKYPSADELAKMQALAGQAMEEGAFGLSMGLEYVPDRFASTDEIVQIAKVASSFGGFCAIHSRDEQTGVLASIAETVQIAREARAPVQISHLKACGKEVWGYSSSILSMVFLARSMGIDITADVYPYTASRTYLSQLYPAWALEGGKSGLEERWADPLLKKRIRSYSASQIQIRVGEDFSLIQISVCPSNREWEGLAMSEVLSGLGKEQSMDNLLDLVHMLYTATGDVFIIYHYINEQDINAFIRAPFVMVASDGEIHAYQEGSPHPRSYGAFPRVLSRYVNNANVLSAEEAVYKMSAMPAARMGLVDRGLVKEGFWADLAIYDENGISDRASFQNPHQYPTGIEYVLVNGEVAVEESKLANAASGMALFGPGCKALTDA
ncbi:MAG: D-aminoacylase [Eubacteriaceae bacterium]|nr:D-aminoacylase [Eubacteriaceae bacterium]